MTAQRLRIERARLEVRQAELAAFLGVPQSRISRAERGEIRLTREESDRARQFFARKHRERQQSRKAAV